MLLYVIITIILLSMKIFFYGHHCQKWTKLKYDYTGSSFEIKKRIIKIGSPSEKFRCNKLEEQYTRIDSFTVKKSVKKYIFKKFEFS